MGSTAWVGLLGWLEPLWGVQTGFRVPYIRVPCCLTTRVATCCPVLGPGQPGQWALTPALPSCEHTLPLSAWAPPRPLPGSWGSTSLCHLIPVPITAAKQAGWRAPWRILIAAWLRRVGALPLLLMSLDCFPLASPPSPARLALPLPALRSTASSSLSLCLSLLSLPFCLCLLCLSSLICALLVKWVLDTGSLLRELLWAEALSTLPPAHFRAFAHLSFPHHTHSVSLSPVPGPRATAKGESGGVNCFFSAPWALLCAHVSQSQAL